VKAVAKVHVWCEKLLQSVLGSLDQYGDAGDLSAALDNIVYERRSAVSRLEWAYQADKERYGSTIAEQGSRPPPTYGEIRDGYRYVGGPPGAESSWEPVQ
jgi:hypothetical protein